MSSPGATGGIMLAHCAVDRPVHEIANKTGMT